MTYSIVHYTACVPSEIIWSTVPHGDFEPRINELAAYAIQEITGKDFGFTTCADSRPRMSEIIELRGHNTYLLTSEGC